MEWEKIAELKLKVLEQEYEECLAAQIKITDANQFIGLKTLLELIL